MKKENWRFSTQGIHAGMLYEEMEGSLAPPTFQTSTFVFPSAKAGGNCYTSVWEKWIHLSTIRCP